MVGWMNKWGIETGAFWAIAKRSDRGVLGRIGIRKIDLEEGSGEITYWVLREARGAGVASRSTNVVCTWAFEQLGLHRLELRHSVLNAPSCRVAAKSLFEMQGTLRSALQQSDGWPDFHLHARLNPNSA
jgi:RimJ/RimL family protein N-acetyltransferase